MLTVKKNYRDVPYHNWTHAFAVAHSMYLVIRSGNDKFTALEVRDSTILLITTKAIGWNPIEPSDINFFPQVSLELQNSCSRGNLSYIA